MLVVCSENACSMQWECWGSVQWECSQCAVGILDNVLWKCSHCEVEIQSVCSGNAGNKLYKCSGNVGMQPVCSGNAGVCSENASGL